ncbi:hypothetical protein [Novosphingobium sp.]|uniref:hypothetical protein n=1 Tax=Novosphingobium sp. TaxID=1874826 RepID=UPI0025EE71D1|nr:hypothetical protein [Novosphingobium sp.]
MRCAVLLFALLVAACSGSDEADSARNDRDPVIAGALDDPLMADPDLVGQNQGGAALTGGGPATAEIPPEKRSQDEINTARSAALQAAGGKLDPAPDAAVTTGTSRLAGAVTAPLIAKALGLGSAACRDAMDYTAVWAARLAAPFDVYPRGHVGQSAGSDAAGCRMRVVTFVTPVAPGDVVAFYSTRARTSGYRLERRDEGEDTVLQGARGAAAYAVATHTRDDKLTEVTIATSGL